ncbi:MAG: tetratricopeptide repeat protein, partial [Blastocatellia bacterium]
MSLTTHFVCGLLALSLSINGFSNAVAGNTTPLADARGTVPVSQSDEEMVRALTEQYGHAIVASDPEALRQLWNPQSPNVAARLKFYRGVFTNVRIEFVTLKVTWLEVKGAKAVSHLTTDERQLDKRTGVAWASRDVFHGSCRAMEWSKTDAGWKVEREYSVQDQLAAKLEAAASDEQRLGLLEKEQAFVTDALSGMLITRGQRHQMRADYEKALLCYQLSQTVSERIGDTEGVGGALTNIGLVKSAQHDYEQALLFQQKSLAAFEATGAKRGAAIALENLSQLYRWLGDYRQAFDCGQKSVRLNEEVRNPRGMARALTELASIYGVQNNPQQALAHQERAMKIFEELEDKIQIAILRDDMAREHRALGQYERALELYQIILNQTEGFGDRAGAALIRDEIGSIYTAQGRYTEALEYHRQALSVLETGNQKPGMALTLVNMSNAYLADGKYAEALPLAERAAVLARQIGQPLDLWSALTAVGDCHLALKHPAEARRAFAEAVSIIERLRSQAAGGVEESQRYFEGGLRAHHGLLGLLVKESQPQEALAFAERAKARTLLDALQKGRVSIQKAMTPEEQSQERKLKAELNALNLQLSRITQSMTQSASQSGKPDQTRIADLQARLEKTRLNYEALQNTLYAAHAELKTQRGEAPIIKAEELAALLPDDKSVLLEYAVTDEATYLFAVTKTAGKGGTDVQIFTLPIKHAELTRQIESFRQQLAGRDLGFGNAARRLYDLLLKPAQAQLRGKTNLVIVPDDKLWEMPFQALLNPDNRYVMENSTVSYA